VNLAIGVVDVAVLVTYLIATILFGLWLGRGQRDLSSYLLGDRNLPWWAILISIVSTETSAATFLSVPGLAFKANGGDMRFLQLAAGYIVGRLLIVRILLPLYFKGQLFTAYEVLNQRFGVATKQAASIVFLIPRNLSDGLRLFLLAIVLEEVVGLPLPACVVIMGIAVTLYTLFGGMKSVIWNDCVQFAIYVLGGVVAAAILLSVKLPGGWGQFVDFATQHGKLRVCEFTFDLKENLTFWSGLVGGMFLTLGTHGTDQMMVQRYLCARSRGDAGLALALSGLVVFVQFAFFLFIGILLACFYNEVQPQTFAKTDRVFAVFIVNELPKNVGLVGLVLAAVFSAAMSTSLNSSAACVVNDLVLPRKQARGDGFSEAEQFRLTKLLIIAFGAVQIALGIGAKFVSGTVVDNALAIAGFSAGLLLGLFFLGIFTRVKQASALSGLFGGLLVLTAAKFLPALAPWVPVLAWPWFPVLGVTATMASGLAHHYVVGKEDQN